MKVLEIELTQEMIDYVQRLGFEVDARVHLLDRMFDNHKDDITTKMFDSVPFKKYYKEYETLKAEYDMATKKLEGTIREIVIEKTGNPDVRFNWFIDNFTDLKARIELEEDEED